MASRDRAYTADLVNEEALIRMLISVGAKAAPALARGLYEEGQLAFRVSQQRVPYRWGILKGSGRLAEPEMNGTSVEVKLSYGGSAEKYAMAVHEISKNYRGGKQSKYLLSAVEDRVPGFDARLAHRIQRIIGESSA